MEIPEKLLSEFEGEWISPGDHLYDEARKGWNALFDKRPKAIARCKNVQDVQRAVHFARENALLLSIKGGGHDYAGKSICDGLVIDLSMMRQVQVDPDKQVAVVQGGATLGELDAASTKYNLAVPGGTASSIGIGGLTLGGGTGYLSKLYGLTLDNLLEAQVITADGEERTASNKENPDLFWAIRGGGSNFGVVTSFTFHLHKIESQILSGQYFYPASEAGQVLKHYREFVNQIPDGLECLAFFMNIPPVDPFPESQHGKTAIAIVASHAGDIDEGKQLMLSFESFGNPFMQFIQAMPYVELQKAFDQALPKGMRWQSRSHYFDELTNELIEALIEEAIPLKGQPTVAYIGASGGAVTEIDSTATAFPHRKELFAFHILTGWISPEEDDEHIGWTNSFFEALSPFAAGGVYLNLLADDEPDRVKEAYLGNYSKLAALKQKYDPDNLFRSNHNIRPA